MKETNSIEERAAAITTLRRCCLILKNRLSNVSDYANIDSIVQAYVPAQLALIDLLKESEVESNEERL